jgi:hypothetical protein
MFYEKLLCVLLVIWCFPRLATLHFTAWFSKFYVETTSALVLELSLCFFHSRKRESGTHLRKESASGHPGLATAKSTKVLLSEK